VIYQEDGLRPALFFHSLQFSGDRLQRHIPWDRLKIAAAPFADSFQGPGEPVWRVYDVSLGESPRTGLQTRARTIVRPDSLDPSFFEVDFQKAAAATVVRATGGHHTFSPI
jgi:hypothetical protein